MLTACASRYTANTQLKRWKSPRSATIVGIAVATIVDSTAVMKVAIMQAARTRPRRPAAAFGTSCLALVSDMQRAPAVLTADYRPLGARHSRGAIMILRTASLRLTDERARRSRSK